MRGRGFSTGRIVVGAGTLFPRPGDGKTMLGEKDDKKLNDANTNESIDIRQMHRCYDK